MNRRAEINRFAIFLLCSLVSLGSLAPATTTERSQTTSGQRQKYYTTEIKPLAATIERQANTLFKNYNICSPITPQTVSWLTVDPHVKNLMKKIPECPAFDENCCAFHVFYNILQNLRRDIELLCGQDLARFVTASINQLNVTLSERAALYACENKALPLDGGQVPKMETVEKKMYIWQVLQKYEQFTQKTAKMYSSARM